ncbi:MAG TPA: rod shape-determining protein MreC, partial [Terriglobales bacterium]|nr:rod shape-determining protein MreC [Terriglobales bacterium]
MENLFVRHRNATVLVALLFAQILGLAIQVKRADPTQSDRQTPLVRVWVMGAITPIEKLVVASSRGVRNLWSDYLGLRGVRQENQQLKQQIENLRVEQVRMKEDAAQAQRLQALFKFKEQFIAQTVAAQVIGSSGSEQSRVIYIDKGSNDGIGQDMPVITPEGVVGKIVRVLPSTSQVLLITDPTWGVGGILEKSRLQGIAKGTAAGDLKLANILSDEKVELGERVLTSGGDRIFPKGLPLATVSELLSREDLFLNIRLRPAANLGRLEEVLVITRVDEKTPTAADTANGPVRASDVLAQRLPSVPKQAPPVVPGDKAKPNPPAGG